MKKSIILSSVLMMILFSFCKKEDEFIVEKSNNMIDIGSYFLLEESIASFPYIGKTEAIYIDSMDNELSMEITENQSTGGIFYKYDVYEEGDTVLYNYVSESRNVTILNDSLNLIFTVSLRAIPYYEDPESGFVADVLYIFCNLPDALHSFQSVFLNVINNRTFPDVFTNLEPIPEIPFIDRVFYEVYFTDYSTPASVVYYNYEFGMVSFTDHSGKLWRFERFEE